MFSAVFSCHNQPKNTTKDQTKRSFGPLFKQSKGRFAKEFHNLSSLRWLRRLLAGNKDNRNIKNINQLLPSDLLIAQMEVT